MTRLTTSTQKTPITTPTLSTSKPTKTKDQSKANTTENPSQTTPMSINDRNTTQETTTDSDHETTTQIDQITTYHPSMKDPRIGDNDITEMPSDRKTTTTSMDDLVTDTSPFTESSTTEESGTPTESMGKTTMPTDHSTKRPSRFETTLEYDFNSSIPTTTESMQTKSMDTTTVEQSTKPGIETTTNQILTDVTPKMIETTTGMSQTRNITIGKDCNSRRECANNEICFKKQCKKVCDTNGNVTKLSDDCIKGTCENKII